MDVLVDVSNQRIRLSTHINAFVAGTKSFIRFVFNLSDEWRDLNKYAQFTQGNISYNQSLFNDYYCWLPEDLRPGECTMTLVGENGTTKAVTDALTFKIIDSILYDGGESDPGQPDLSVALIDGKEHYIVTNGGWGIVAGATSARITDLTTSTFFDESDYLMIDSRLYGSRKFRFDILTEEEIENIWEGT